MKQTSCLGAEAKEERKEEEMEAIVNPEEMAVDTEPLNKTPFQTEPMPIRIIDNKWSKPVIENLRQSRKKSKYLNAQKRMAQIHLDINISDNESPREAHQAVLKKIAGAIGTDKIEALYQTSSGKIIIATKKEAHLEELLKKNHHCGQQRSTNNTRYQKKSTCHLGLSVFHR